MPTPIETTPSAFAPPLTRLAPRGLIDIGDDAPRSQAMDSAQLRTLAAQWRSVRDLDDRARAERIARALEWLADYRAPPPRSRLEELGERISGWMGL